jgi:hypothetical protein
VAGSIQKSITFLVERVKKVIFLSFGRIKKMITFGSEIKGIVVSFDWNERKAISKNIHDVIFNHAFYY